MPDVLQLSGEQGCDPFLYSYPATKEGALLSLT